MAIWIEMRCDNLAKAEHFPKGDKRRCYSLDNKGPALLSDGVNNLRMTASHLRVIGRRDGWRCSLEDATCPGCIEAEKESPKEAVHG